MCVQVVARLQSKGESQSFMIFFFTPQPLIKLQCSLPNNCTFFRILARSTVEGVRHFAIQV